MPFVVVVGGGGVREAGGETQARKQPHRARAAPLSMSLERGIGGLQKKVGQRWDNLTPSPPPPTFPTESDEGGGGKAIT